MGAKNTQSQCLQVHVPSEGSKEKNLPYPLHNFWWLLVISGIPHINSKRPLFNVPVDVNIDFKINNVALRNPVYLKKYDVL